MLRLTPNSEGVGWEVRQCLSLALGGPGVAQYCSGCVAHHPITRRPVEMGDGVDIDTIRLN